MNFRRREPHYSILSQQCCLIILEIQLRRQNLLTLKEQLSVKESCSPFISLHGASSTCSTTLDHFSSIFRCEGCDVVIIWTAAGTESTNSHWRFVNGFPVMHLLCNWSCVKGSRTSLLFASPQHVDILCSSPKYNI